LCRVGDADANQVPHRSYFIDVRHSDQLIGGKNISTGTDGYGKFKKRGLLRAATHSLTLGIHQSDVKFVHKDSLIFEILDKSSNNCLIKESSLFQSMVEPAGQLHYRQASVAHVDGAVSDACFTSGSND